MSTSHPPSILREFLSSEAAGGLVLIASAALAMAAANSGHAQDYHRWLAAAVGPTLVPRLGPMTVHLWINDAAMSLFFLLVGLEIKREFARGHLSAWADRRLPFIAAAAGMGVPALVYLMVVREDPGLGTGWAIPAATDIAFALGLLALLGKRVPTSLKLFVTTVAIVDDVGAIAIIALFHAHGLDLRALACAGAVLAVMAGMNAARVTRVLPYLLGFAAMWYFTLLSGVHATVAGVVAAMTIPLRPAAAGRSDETSPLYRVERALQRPVAFGVVPLFAFANAGVSLGQAEPFATLPLALALGLFAGKQIGVFGGIWLAVRLRIARRPAGASWRQVYGVALLCGIGFTMSLFIGGLAFPAAPHADLDRVGVLAGSVLSALAGVAVLALSSRRRSA